ncbi:MAG: tetratricopeptide repeat protein [Acidobacteriaceae bacterium]
MRRHLPVMLIAVAWAAWMVVPCGAQATPGAQSAPADNPAPCSVAPEPQPCSTTPTPPGKASAKEKFPFPGEAGAIGPSTSGLAAPSLSGVPEAPDAGSSATPTEKKDAAKEFPFPGDAAKADASSSSGAGSSSSSSSSGDDASPADSSAPGLTDAGSEGSATPGRHLLHRLNPVGTKLQTIDEREQEDLDVAHFYIQSGDLQGAYLRNQDAVKVAPDDPDAHIALAEIALKLNKPDVAAAEYNACLKLDEDAVKASPNDPDAHFWLAQMAEKLNKRDEAIAEYTACLKLHPDGKEAREARKALASLKP